MYNEATPKAGALKQCLASKLLGSRDSVGLSLVGIVGDTSIGRLVRAREADKTRRLGAATTRDLELMATGVELSTGVLVRGMQRKDLVTDEVVAGGNALGDGVLDTTASLLDGVGTPHVGGTGATLFLNLEPDSTGLAVSISRMQRARSYVR
jgi:hypothetical protein